MTTDKTTTRISLSCPCSTCRGAKISADSRIIVGATDIAQISHTFVAYSLGASPLASMMCARYDITPED